MTCSFNTDLVSTTLNSQRVRNAIWWLAHSILTSSLPLWTLSLCVMPFDAWLAHSILTLSLPLWTLSLCVIPFGDLLIQYWPRLYHFELSASASCHLMSCLFNTDLISTTLNSQRVRNTIWWLVHSILTSSLPLWIPRKCVVPFDDLLLQYWPCPYHFELSGGA